MATNGRPKLKNPSHALRVSHTHGTKKRKLMLELWKVVPDYPNYKISSFGRVEKHGKISDFSNRNGDYYLSEYMGNESGSIIKYVHVLVAELFIGEKPSPLHIVNHKDRNKRNNRVDNLEYLTKSENSKHWLTVGNQSKNIPDHSKQVWLKNT